MSLACKIVGCSCIIFKVRVTGDGRVMFLVGNGRVRLRLGSVAKG